MSPLLLLLPLLLHSSLGTTDFSAAPTTRATTAKPTASSAEEAAFLTALTKECWKTCQASFTDAEGTPSIFDVVAENFKAHNYTRYCHAYHANRNCAYACVTSEHEYYLKSFLAINNLNEVICVDRKHDFAKYHAHLDGSADQPLSFFYKGCNVPNVASRLEIAITPDNCKSVKCALEYVPQVIKEESASAVARSLMKEMMDGYFKDHIPKYDALLKGCGL